MARDKLCCVEEEKQRRESQASSKHLTSELFSFFISQQLYKAG
jgi:hypothetical protein